VSKRTLGLTLAVVHALVFALVILSRPPDPPCQPCDPMAPGMCLDPCSLCCQTYVAGRSFHGGLSFNLLVLGDLPAAFLAGLTMEVVYRVFLGRPPENGPTGDSYGLAGLWLCLATVQWGLIGARLARRTAGRREEEAQ
jgi:hypothetical protein